jgi:hypothetical protein
VSLLNIENTKWLVATLAIPFSLFIVSHYYQATQEEAARLHEAAQTKRQFNEARLQLYTELLSKREEADTAVRRGIFDKVLERYLKPGGQEPQAKIVALDLLARNFYDSLDLSPLFLQLEQEVQHAPPPKQKALSAQLHRIANGVRDRQISALLVGSGQEGQATMKKDLQFEPSGKLKEAAVVDKDLSFSDGRATGTGAAQTRHLKLSIVDHDPARRRVWAVVIANGKPGEKDQQWGFWIDAFDFPIERISRTERFSVVMQRYEPPYASVRLVYFPSARIGVKDKPFIDDVISELLENK